VQALDWLVICPSQGGEALWHANALVRKFVSQGKLELARAAYNKIPQESMRELCQKMELCEGEKEPTIPSRHQAALKEHFSFKIYLVGPVLLPRKLY
jgi:nuclear pore complex protein Nup107